MNVIFRKPSVPILLAMLAVPVTGLSAQPELQPAVATTVGGEDVNVYGSLPADLSGMAKGPDVEGFISARQGDRLLIAGEDGSVTEVTIGQATEVRSRGGFLGLNRTSLAQDHLLNGLPVSVDTVQWGPRLAASRIDLKDKDLKLASMIHNGTAQGFAEQTAATEALRSRVGDLDQYNIKYTTNVNFDVGKAALSPDARQELCSTASQAEQMDNALLLVVGYTDSTGSQEFNQQLSEKRASGVVNHLQQACGWKPYRMLTPTGMAEADPLADNETPFGKAQNRRVAVNVLVSKGLDGI